MDSSDRSKPRSKKEYNEMTNKLRRQKKNSYFVLTNLSRLFRLFRSHDHTSTNVYECRPQQATNQYQKTVHQGAFLP